MEIKKKTKAEEMAEKRAKQKELKPIDTERKKYFSKIRNAVGKRAKKKGY